jgi:hypothetical protein
MKALLALLIAVASASPLIAQNGPPHPLPDSAAATTDVPYRDPRTALVLGSLIPGAGYIYAGEYLHGVETYLGTVSGIGAGVMLYIADKCMFSFLNASPCHSGPQWPHQLAGGAIVGVSLWGWISSARDAVHAAERVNERHRRNLSKPDPVIEPPAGPHEPWRIGIALHW